MWVRKIYIHLNPHLASALRFLVKESECIKGATIKTEKDIQDLLEACQKGDRKSQNELYKMFYGFAMRICLRYSRSEDEAIEILNDGFYKIMTNLDTLQLCKYILCYYSIIWTVLNDVMSGNVRKILIKKR